MVPPMTLWVQNPLPPVGAPGNPVSLPSNSPITPPIQNPRYKYGNYDVLLPPEGDMGDRTGWTPIVPRFPVVDSPTATDMLNNILEAFQKSRLIDYSSRDLADLGVRTTRPLKASTLQQILPVLRPSRWETAVGRPDGDLRTELVRMTYKYPNSTGVWAMNNPAVYEVMKPVLLLASAILTSAPMSAWFDAVFFGTRYILDASYSTQDLTGIMSFWRRPQTPQTRQETKASISEMLGKQDSQLFNWGFKEGSSPITANESYNETDGVSWCDNGPNASDFRAYCYVSFKHVETLLRTDLNDHERRSVEYYVMSTIVHEFTHAMWLVHWKMWVEEQYFEEEPLAEFGFSMEHAVLGGGPDVIWDHPNVPVFIWRSLSYPILDDIARANPNMPVLNKDPSKFNNLQRNAFIPAQTLEDLHSSEFWDIGIQKFGFDLMHFRAPLKGLGRTLTGNFDANGIAQNVTQGPWYQIDFVMSGPALVQQQLVADIQQLANSPPNERRAYDLGKGLVESAADARNFWNTSQTQRNSVDEIMKIWASMLRIPKNLTDPAPAIRARLEKLAKIGTQIEKAITAHQESFQSLLALEAFNIQTNIPRRRDILRWNAGTRAFVNQLQKIELANGGARSASFLELLVRLECVRMQIFSPTMAPDVQLPPHDPNDPGSWTWENPEVWEFDWDENMWLYSTYLLMIVPTTAKATMEARITAHIRNSDNRTVLFNKIIVSALTQIGQGGFFLGTEKNRMTILLPYMKTLTALKTGIFQRGVISAWTWQLDEWMTILEGAIFDDPNGRKYSAVVRRVMG